MGTCLGMDLEVVDDNEQAKALRILVSEANHSTHVSV